MATSHCGQMTSLEQRATSAALRGRVRSAGWVRVSRGLYRRPLAEPELADDLRGWQLALPASGAFSHLTGAVLRGWWVPPLPLDLPVFAGISHADPRPRRTGLLVCRHTRDVRCEERAGLRVATAPEICSPPPATSVCWTWWCSPTRRCVWVSAGSASGTRRKYCYETGCRCCATPTMPSTGHTNRPGSVPGTTRSPHRCSPRSVRRGCVPGGQAALAGRRDPARLTPPA